MYILYFDNECWDKYHAAFEASNWFSYDSFKAGESFWLVPGTHPEDCFYVCEY